MPSVINWSMTWPHGFVSSCSRFSPLAKPAALARLLFLLDSVPPQPATQALLQGLNFAGCSMKCSSAEARQQLWANPPVDHRPGPAPRLCRRDCVFPRVQTLERPGAPAVAAGGTRGALKPVPRLGQQQATENQRRPTPVVMLQLLIQPQTAEQRGKHRHQVIAHRRTCSAPSTHALVPQEVGEHRGTGVGNRQQARVGAKRSPVELIQVERRVPYRQSSTSRRRSAAPEIALASGAAAPSSAQSRVASSMSRSPRLKDNCQSRLNCPREKAARATRERQ